VKINHAAFYKISSFSLVTFGIYPLYFYVTRQEETNELLKEIIEELKRRKIQ